MWSMPLKLQERSHPQMRRRWNADGTQIKADPSAFGFVIFWWAFGRSADKIAAVGSARGRSRFANEQEVHIFCFGLISI